ncbi:endonuclease/exonuclease/phosphatase family protein [Kitasatospora purpeofusca]|uniref:endonuclease/exonuclease/phosphatase family protein n=1 Tax=Kitasatospora purpeofusca TaxID=67352 RepID=UPI002252A682|nr:endonuclease/exonuclease/phosphatase family protein [Kitasatospora purpeofusca]MCX4683875.1 endonuclease/exonuclease/phosphatase family protein [Kitasatospora purpeofusca]
MDPDSVSPRSRHSAGVRLLVAATALWAAFLALDLMANGRWWFWLVPALAPPLLFLAVPVTLLALAWTLPAAGSGLRRWLVPTAVLLLVAALPRTGLNWSSLGPGPAAAPAGPGIRVFSWNTEYWDTTDDPDAFYRFLHAQDADVYLLQEYLAWVRGTHTPIDELDRIRREFPGYQVVAAGELVTLSRFPVLATPTVGPAVAADAPWSEVFTRRKVLRTDLDVRGRAVSFYNVHIPVQVDTRESVFGRAFYRVVREADTARREQFAALERDTAANSRPLLVAGDFNTSPAMADLDPLRARLHDARAASGDLYPGSWGGILGADWWRLDWAFTNDGASVDHYAFVDDRGLSDHGGQELRISLPQRGQDRCRWHVLESWCARHPRHP